MELDEIKERIDKYFENIKTEEYIEVLNKYKCPIEPSIVWVGDNKANSDLYSKDPVCNSIYFDNVHDLRKCFSTHSYVYFPFKYHKLTHNFVLTYVPKYDRERKIIPDYIDGYFILDKRSIRTKEAKNRYIKASELKEKMQSEVRVYMNYLNEIAF